MRLSKEELLAIRELNLSGKLDKMDDIQFENYCGALSVFIDAFPNKEAYLKAYLSVGNMEGFSTTLTEVMKLLTDIYAVDLVKSCEKMIGDAKVVKPAVLEAHLTYFITAASSLSIDIQMLQHMDESSGLAKPAGRAVAQNLADSQSEKNVLAVDDVSLVLSGLKNALNNTRYKFTGVTSGAAALKYLSSHTPDLLILDVEMPQMNGYELAAKIREMGHTAPIVFLTGNATNDYVMKAIQAGAAGFIVKPINLEQVLEKVKQYIGD